MKVTIVTETTTEEVIKNLQETVNLLNGNGYCSSDVVQAIDVIRELEAKVKKLEECKEENHSCLGEMR